MYLYLFSLTISRDFFSKFIKKSFEVEKYKIRVIVGEERCKFNSEVLIHVSENQFHIFTYCKIAIRQSHLHLKWEFLQEFHSCLVLMTWNVCIFQWNCSINPKIKVNDFAYFAISFLESYEVPGRTCQLWSWLLLGLQF